MRAAARFVERWLDEPGRLADVRGACAANCSARWR
jgi:hypothetical protein